MDKTFIYYYILWKYLLAGKKEGEKSIIERKLNRNLSLILKIRDKHYIHIHHWIYLPFILGISKKKFNTYIKNLCWSGIINGLMYDDSFDILIPYTGNNTYFLKKLKD